MAFQPTGQGAKVVVTYQHDTDYWSNILWFYMDAFDVDDLQALATQVKASLVDNLVDYLALGAFISGVVATDERTQDGAVRVGAGGGGTGDVTGDALPRATSLVLTLRTDNRGRAYRGRVYVSGFTESQMVEAGWGGTLPQDVAAAFLQMRDDVALLGWTWGVRSGVLNGVERPFAIVTAITTVESRSPIPGFQRRRTPRP